MAGELSVAQWPLYIDRAKGGRRPSLEAFQRETGIRVDHREIINDNYAFFAKLVPLFEAGEPTGWDIIALSDWVVGLMVERGWLLPLDRSLLPTVDANLLPAFRDPAYDPGNAHSVPWQGGVTGIAYYPELVGGRITAFADLWNPRLEGRVGMLTEMVDGVREIMLQKAEELKGADREYYETLANSPLLFPPRTPPPRTSSSTRRSRGRSSPPGTSCSRRCSGAELPGPAGLGPAAPRPSARAAGGPQAGVSWNCPRRVCSRHQATPSSGRLWIGS